MNYTKFQRVIQDMNNHNIDIFILTEAKGWNPQWTKELQGDKYKIGAIENLHEDARRGGIVTLYRLGQVSIQNCYSAKSTFNALHVTFESGKIT